MESFMDLIFSNLFLIIVILTSIFSFFNKNKEEQKKKTNRPKPVQTPPSRSKNMGRPSSRSPQQPEPIAMKSMEDQKIEQIDRLREQFQKSTKDRLEDLNEQYSSTIKDNLRSRENNLKRKIDHKPGLKFNQKNVLQGIMMSEVLGSPRSRKPYRSVIEQRKMK